jgi:hypothetical protein
MIMGSSSSDQFHRKQTAALIESREMHELVVEGTLEELKSALDRGLSPHAKTIVRLRRSSLLGSAASTGDLEKIRLVASRGGVANPDNTELLPLGSAAFGKSATAADAVKELLRLGAKVNATDHAGVSALHYAAASAATASGAESCAVLLAAGASVEAQDAAGQTPLHWAARANRADVCALLIENGANPMARDNEGRAPLHYAVRFGASEAIEALVKGGADPLAKDDWGRPTTRGIGRDPIQENRTAEGRRSLKRAVAELRPEIEAQLSQSDSLAGRLKSFLEASRQRILPGDSAKNKGPAV